MTWFRFQADTGLQAAYTDPINPVFNASSPQPLYSFATGYTHVFSQNLVNYFNPAFSWYESLFGPTRLVEDAGGVADCASRESVHNDWGARQHVGSGPAGVAVVLERQSGLDARRA